MSDKCDHAWPNMVRYLDQKCMYCGVARPRIGNEEGLDKILTAAYKKLKKGHRNITLIEKAEAAIPIPKNAEAAALRSCMLAFFEAELSRTQQPPQIKGLDEALAYFSSDDEKRKQDGDLEYINYGDRLETVLQAAKAYAALTNEGR